MWVLYVSTENNNNEYKNSIIISSSFNSSKIWSQELTSLAAEYDHTTYVAPEIPKATTTVLLFQFEGLDHHPPFFIYYYSI